jgi:lipoprotein-anchoring transpeptidase ErfK/SrfK
MRWIVLTLAAAAAGGLYAVQAPVGEQQLALSASAVRVPAAAQAVPRDTDKRIYLAPEQQRQASAEGGFRQVPLSLLRVDRRMHYGDFEWDDTGVPRGPVTIRVDLRTQLMSVFRAGHEIGTAVALYGADSKETPLGSFPILWKGRNHRSSLYDAPMPFTLRLTGDGVAIHGSNVRWGAATHGCVGVPTEFASRLFEQARIGDVVTIVRTATVAEPPRS